MEAKKIALEKSGNFIAIVTLIGIKIATGRATREEYTEEIARMNELAAEVNQVNEQLEALKASEEK